MSDIGAGARQAGIPQSLSGAADSKATGRHAYRQPLLREQLAAPCIHHPQPWRVQLFIQIHSDNQIPSDNDRDTRLEEQVRQRLARFEERITDVEIHVSDINGPRGGAADLRCTLEARVNGIQPVAVADQGSSVDRAVLGAAKKAVRALDHQLGKLTDRKGH